MGGEGYRDGDRVRLVYDHLLAMFVVCIIT